MVSNLQGLKYHLLIYISCSLAIVISGCLPSNLTTSSGPVWLDEVVITSSLDSNGDPVDHIAQFDHQVRRVYCFARIRGPQNVRMGARWFYQDTMIVQTAIVFGTTRKGAIMLERDDGSLLLPGEYRCEVFVVDKPLASIRFRVE